MSISPLSPNMRLVDESLRLLTTLSDALVPDAGGVTVALERSGRLTTVAATDDRVGGVDRAQYDVRPGPCVSATLERRQHHAPSLPRESRWPRFTPYALDAGYASIKGALRSRKVIAQAQGVLMERFGSSPGGAYGTMRDAARRTETTLRHQTLDLVMATRRREPHSDRGVHMTLLDVLEQGWRDVGLSQADLWFRYFELGGMSSELEIEAILLGALLATPHNRNIIAVAINERFFEQGRDHPMPYLDGDPDDGD